MAIFIGLVAEKESGKTTTFNFIKEGLPTAQEIMLAEHLKNVCAKVFKMDLYCFESQSEKKRILENPVILTRKNITDIVDLFELNISEEGILQHLGKELTTTRAILQYVGTDIVRAIEDDIHLKWAVRLAPKSDVYVITDIRFPNEFEFFNKKEGFLPFAIERGTRDQADVASHHASETYVASLKRRCLASIDNNGTLEHLKTQVCDLIVSKALSLKDK